MHILIDGYNLIKQALEVRRIPDAKRLAFIKQLAQHAQLNGHSLIIVFDGGQFGFPNEEKQYGVTIMYSGYKQTADDVIKQYLSDYRNRTTLLVSSDRELRDHARLINVESMGALEYWQLVTDERRVEQQRSKRYDEEAIKMTDTHNDELDVLMQEASEYVPHKNEQEQSSRESQSQRLSKKERKLQQIKKKL